MAETYEAAVAAQTRTAVYRLYDAAEDLIYVGCTANPPKRLIEHHSKAWWPEVARQEVEWHPDRPAALDAEARAIREEGPRCNRLVPGARPVRRERQNSDARDVEHMHEIRVDAIRAVAQTDSARAYWLATEYAEQLAAARSQAAALRSEMTRAAMRSYGLSIAGVAEMFGLTKGTAQQILGKKPLKREKSD